jgi:membrane-associated phospholipid phosphatase
MNSNFYLNQQKLLAASKWYRRFWEFWGIYIVGFFYAGIVLFFLPNFRNVAILSSVAFLFVLLVVRLVFYFFYKKCRPYQKLNFSPPASPFFLSSVHKKFNSMPSAHAASLTAISCVCLAFFPLLGVLGLIATIFNGVARVILGYHYPSDILVGWLVGLLSAFGVVYWLAPLLFTH